MQRRMAKEEERNFLTLFNNEKPARHLGFAVFLLASFFSRPLYTISDHFASPALSSAANGRRVKNCRCAVKKFAPFFDRFLMIKTFCSLGYGNE